jgi:hypothetical protein
MSRTSVAQKVTYVPHKLTDAENKAIVDLIAFAKDNRITVDQTLVHAVNNPRSQNSPAVQAYMTQVWRQSIEIGTEFVVSYLEEYGHSKDRVSRHLFAYSKETFRAPNASTLWAIAEKFGFKGSVFDCIVYFTKFVDEKGYAGRSVNFLQTIG